MRLPLEFTFDGLKIGRRNVGVSYRIFMVSRRDRELSLPSRIYDVCATTSINGIVLPLASG
jgi:hypothetical protein